MAIAFRNHQPASRLRRFAAAAGVASFWAIPVAVATVLATGHVPIVPIIVVRATLLMVAPGLLLYLGLAPARGHKVAFVAASCAGVAMLVSPAWSAPWIAAAWLALTALLVGWLSMPRAARTVDLLAPILTMTAALLMAAFTAVAVMAVNSHRLSPEERAAVEQVRWRPALSVSNAPAPDVYHIVLDAFGRPDRLNQLMGADVGKVVSALKSRGFTVSAKGYANYDLTYLSLASMLNMGYINPVAEVMSDSQSMMPLYDLISKSTVAEAFGRLGYRRVVLGANYSATTRLEAADECRCGPTGFGSFESTIMAMTPLRHGLGGLEYVPHRRRIEETFAALESIESGTQPVWVFAHVLAPHEPFVFDRDGGPVAPVFAFPGTREEFRRRYEDQAKYIGRRTVQAIDSVLAQRARTRRPVVIIVNGDHNVRFQDSIASRAEDGREALPILLAIHWAEPGVTDEIRSPVNIYRELFGRYFGGDRTPLADVGYLSSVKAPYQLIEGIIGD